MTRPAQPVNRGKNLIEWHCWACNQRLFDANIEKGEVEIKCPKSGCGAMNRVER